MGDREKPAIEVLLGIDVEEEGLFRSVYKVFNPPTANIEHIGLLKSFMDLGVRPTLFCAHSVLADDRAYGKMENLRSWGKMEIAAHLHYWNTPPLLKNTPEFYDSVSVRKIPDEIFEKKLHTLLVAAHQFAGVPVTGFRMGRWDIHKKHWEILSKYGIERDASVRPFHFNQSNTGADHYNAPQNPYWIKCHAGDILEVPLTVTPLVPGMPELLKRSNSKLKASLPKWGLLTLLPVEHPLAVLKMTTRIFIARGGSLISVNWHSSEMMPGGTPKISSKNKRDKFLKKMLEYFQWLNNFCHVKYVTLSEVSTPSPAYAPMDRDADWTNQY